MDIEINKLSENQRVDKYIRKMLSEAPLSFIYKMFRKKDIKVNGKKVEGSYILKDGDKLHIYITESMLNKFANKPQLKKVKPNLNVIYEDDNICIVNKPKGLIVHSDEKEQRITLQNIFLNYLQFKGEYNLEKLDGFVPSPAHRLDRNTSGIVILAKNLMAMKELYELFKEKNEVKKTYILLAYEGKHINDVGEINLPLKKDDKTGIVSVCSTDRGGKEAKTCYKIINRYGRYILLEAELITGRTHQLRVHFASIGCPIIGDGKYGNFKINDEFLKLYGLKNQFLHAYSFEFLNISGNLSYLSQRKFFAKLPEVLGNVLVGVKNEC